NIRSRRVDKERPAWRGTRGRFRPLKPTPVRCRRPCRAALVDLENRSGDCQGAALFSIGIDLGTTNSALAYAPLNGDAPPNTLPIQQWETPETLVEVPMLSSFLYLPEDALAQELNGEVPRTQGWIVGRLACRRAAELPG